MPKLSLTYKDIEGKHVKAYVMLKFVAMEDHYLR